MKKKGRFSLLMALMMILVIYNASDVEASAGMSFTGKSSAKIASTLVTPVTPNMTVYDLIVRFDSSQGAEISYTYREIKADGVYHYRGFIEYIGREGTILGIGYGDYLYLGDKRTFKLVHVDYTTQRIMGNRAK